MPSALFYMKNENTGKIQKNRKKWSLQNIKLKKQIQVGQYNLQVPLAALVMKSYSQKKLDNLGGETHLCIWHKNLQNKMQL